MNEFTEPWLQKQGLKLPPKTLTELSNTLEQVLEMRVGLALSSQFTDSQLEEITNIIQNTDEDDTDKKRINWLEKNFPNYNDITRSQKAKLSKEVRNSKDKAAFIKQLGKAEIPS